MQKSFRTFGLGTIKRRMNASNRKYVWREDLEETKKVTKKQLHHGITCKDKLPGTDDDEINFPAASGRRRLCVCPSASSGISNTYLHARWVIKIIRQLECFFELNAKTHASNICDDRIGDINYFTTYWILMFIQCAMWMLISPRFMLWFYF